MADGQVIVVNPADELPADDIGEAIIEAGSDAVEIARIEADKEITIAAIHAETEQVSIEAHAEARAVEAEAYVEREDRWQDHQNQLANLQEQVSSLTEAITSISTLLASSSDPEQEAETVIVADEVTTISTPQSTSDETNLTPMEVISESVEEKPAVVPERKRVRLI